jgi:zinc protease
VSAYHYSPTEVGVFSVNADLPPGELRPALRAIAGEVNRLRSEGPADADLERIKTMLTVQWARRLESVDGRATALAALEALGGYRLMEEEYERLQAVTAADVRRVADRYLAPDAVAGVVYRPFGAQVELTPEAIREGFAASPAPSPNGRRPAAAPERPPRPAAGRRAAGVLHVALPGVDLLLRPKPGVPLVTFGAYRRRGAIEVRDTAGLANLSVRAAARGAGPWDAAELALVFERLGGSLGVNVGLDWWGYSASVAAGHLGAAAGVLREVLFAPRFEPKEVLRERDTLIDEAVQAADDMFRHPIQLALVAAFGEHGYGLPVKGLPASLAGFDESSVRRWHQSETAQGRLALIAVGDFDPDRAADLLAGVFDGLPEGAAPVRTDWDRLRGGPGRRSESRSKSQTALAMVFPGPSRKHPARHAAEVAGAISSGLGGRLFSALRDQRSLAYVVMMSSWQRAFAGGVITYIATSPEREEEARDSMLAELSRLRTELVSEDELARAVRYLVGQSEVHRQTGAALASEILDAWLIGEGLGELVDPAAGYRAVTREGVREFAALYLEPEQRAEGLVVGSKGAREE